MDQQPEDEAYKFGIQFEPPSLVYVYRDKNTRKLTRYMMPVRNFSVDSDYKFVAKDIKDRHEDKLKPIAIDKVEIALRLLMNHMKGSSTKKNMRNQRLFHVGPKIKSPKDPLLKKLSKLSVSDGRSECTTDSENGSTT